MSSSRVAIEKMINGTLDKKPDNYDYWVIIALWLSGCPEYKDITRKLYRTLREIKVLPYSRRVWYAHGVPDKMDGYSLPQIHCMTRIYNYISEVLPSQEQKKNKAYMDEALISAGIIIDNSI